MIIAKCERCEGVWYLPKMFDQADPDVFEGVCHDCQEDSDVERPLTFSIALELPEDWLADEE